MSSKGGKSTSEIKLPKVLEGAAKENIALAKKVGGVGYVPYNGPTVAALAPETQASFKNNANAAGAFGLAGSGIGASAGMPPVQTVKGGVSGYSPMANYNDAKGNIPQGQLDAIKAFVINPKTGAAPGSSGGGGGTKTGTGGGTGVSTGTKYKLVDGKLVKVSGTSGGGGK